MKIKLSDKSKTYWINYFGYWLIFVLFWLIISGAGNYESEPIHFDFKFGFIFTSIITSFILAHFVAKKYSGNE